MFLLMNYNPSSIILNGIFIIGNLFLIYMLTPRDIKSVRQNFNITQAQFANMAGVSQSMIAKVEGGKLDPTYSNFEKIVKAVEKFSEQNEKTAKDIMNPKIITAELNTKLLSVNKIMKKHGISQIPVMQGNNIIGLITEGSILNSDLSMIDVLTAEAVMIDSPPIISESTGVSLISTLLKHFPLVFVKNQGDFVGIITKADLLEKLL